ncbi:MAG: NAD-glutamate dehydrogenase [Rhodospirillaceae bacterium]
MTKSAEDTKTSLVRKTVAFASEYERSKMRGPLKHFIQQFYEDSPPADLVDASPGALYAAAVSAFEFSKNRPVGKPLLRVLTPDTKKGRKEVWPTERTVIEIINDDMPFLVDSVTAELERLGEPALFIIHPVIPVKRDTDGTLIDVYPEDEPFLDEVVREEKGVHFESVMHVQIPKETDHETIERIGDTMRSVLRDVRLAVDDWREMRRQAAHIAADFDGGSPGLDTSQAQEVEDFLHWLHDDHYTFLGYREFTIEAKGKNRILHVQRENNLGVLKKPSLVMFDGVRSGAPVPPLFADFLDESQPLLIVKANHRATVHRRVHYDVVIVKCYNEQGKVVSLRFFAGMFTADVYTSSPNFVPVLRRKIDRIRDHIGFRKHSHDGKRLQNIMENLPRDELFESTDEHLIDVALGLLHLQERSKTALFVRRDNFERFVSCLVYVPRDRFDTQLRLTIADLLTEAFAGRVSSFYTQVTDSALARIHYIIATAPGKMPLVDVKALEAEISAAARAWQDDLETALANAHGEAEAKNLHDRYAHAFPVAYRETYSFEETVFDIRKIEAVLRDQKVALHLHDQRNEKRETQLHLKVYAKSEPLILSDVLPVIENMGFTVVGEVPFQVTPRGSTTGGGPLWIHDFSLKVSNGHVIQPEEVRDGVHEAFSRVWSGEMESDGFNRLVPLAGLAWRDVVILRAYAKFLRQAAFPFSQAYVESAFTSHPAVARLLIDLFMALFDPSLTRRKPSKKSSASKKSNADKVRAQIISALDEIVSADEDRILRRYLMLIEATLRTNFFQTSTDGVAKDYLSLKLNSRIIDDLPQPRPWKEIFVYSPRVEAVHLRGGAVARGGLRWSDRPEDFRSEILGLVKAQMVKNAVIVPTGSKGGFIVKNPPAAGGREAFQAEGIACYQIMQRGLLDITDNVVNDKVVPPKKVVRRDGDDPYLVVAADKGTATFSDIANAVSEDEYGHWLGDAYASGGTYGYDHKAMGITAKGAWESVKRHFRELGLDTQKENFTVVGVGDMSGDVFGNGMLLSKHIQLLAAFNHMHIFIDPDPDAASSWKERNRLFKLGRSSWTDYNTKLISKGGGVFERSAKSLKISPEIRKALGLEKAQVTPNELMTAILTAEADLMWFGGIGTYIKADDESHADASDRANDTIRINADDVRVRVIGEGANLGVTQRGRIACGLNGTKLNTDAIDNSAGVDCSDHEVNIKILLNGLVQNNKLTLKARNQLLEKMTEEVSGLVLRDNYQQTQTISFIEARGASVLDAQQRAMKIMERDGLLDRALEFLPDDETIVERSARGQGLTRPEISVLVPYSKMWLYNKVVQSGLPDDPMMEDDLISYFPKPIQKKYPDAILNHKLRREIIATVATNSFINRVGASFMTQMMERTGVGPVDVVRAYLVTRLAYDLRSVWNDIEALDNKVSALTQTHMLEDVYSMIERSVLWLLRNKPSPIDVAAVLKSLGPQVAEFKRIFAKVVSPEVKSYIDGVASTHSDNGVPKALAHKVASLYRLAAANDVAHISEATQKSIADTAETYFCVGNRFGLGVLRARARAMSSGTHWQKLAVSAAIEEIFALQSAITKQVLSSTSKGGKAKKGKSGGQILADWIENNHTGVERFDQLNEELRNSEEISLAMLTVTNRQLAALVSSA